MSNNKVYLGDGVYGYFDGYQVIIETMRYDENICQEVRHWIALESYTMETLISFARKAFKGEVPISEE